MKEAYLQVTFRRGQPFAGYYYLPRRLGNTGARVRRVEPGLVVDFAADGRPIGIEITAPQQLSVDAFNRALEDLGLPKVTSEDLAPLHAA